ncbi:MAG: 30S ribosomal protein S8 [Candidatus Dormibacteria bacterium]
MVSDPIADLLTRIRNGALAHHATVAVPHSGMKEHIVKVLVEEGFIDSFEVTGEVPAKSIVVTLKPPSRRQGKALNGLKRVSSPGRRVYAGKQEIPRVLNGLGVAIISTSRGIMTGREAHHLGIGGEVVAYVW